MLKIDVWSDIACPWCWLGKHHLEEALRRSGQQAEVEFRSFELQPHAREPRPVRDYLAARYGGDLRPIDAAHARLADAGRRVGIVYDFERALMANTFDAHRLHHLAKARGLGAEVVERFMQARQGEGADISDRATLRRLAIEAGLDAEEIDRVLSSDEYTDDVRADEQAASEFGISGVPYFVFDGRYAVSGAQPVEVFEQVLAKLREASATQTPSTG